MCTQAGRSSRMFSNTEQILEMAGDSDKAMLRIICSGYHLGFLCPSLPHLLHSSPLPSCFYLQPVSFLRPQLSKGLCLLLTFFPHTWCCFTSLLLVSKGKDGMLSLASKNWSDPQRFSPPEGMELVSQPCHFWVSLLSQVLPLLRVSGRLTHSLYLDHGWEHWKWMVETRNLSASVLKRSLASRILQS